MLVLAVVRLGIPVLASGPETEIPSTWLQLSITPLFALSGALAGLLAMDISSKRAGQGRLVDLSYGFGLGCRIPERSSLTHLQFK